jgi:DNA-binding NarL/FixJ family response regulator
LIVVQKQKQIALFLFKIGHLFVKVQAGVSEKISKGSDYGISLAKLLQSRRPVPDMEVAGEVANGEDAIREAAKLQPGVILMDIQMPGMNGIDATRAIYQASPHIGVIVLTMFEDDDSIFAAMRVGICSKGQTRPKSCAPSTRSRAAKRCLDQASRGG